MSARLHGIPDLIADQLAIAHADTRATLAAIARKTNGASDSDLLLAAIALLRDQAARIAELDGEVGFLFEEKEQVEGERNEMQEELTALKKEIKKLAAELPTEEPWT